MQRTIGWHKLYENSLLSLRAWDELIIAVDLCTLLFDLVFHNQEHMQTWVNEKCRVGLWGLMYHWL